MWHRKLICAVNAITCRSMYVILSKTVFRFNRFGRKNGACCKSAWENWFFTLFWVSLTHTMHTHPRVLSNTYCTFRKISFIPRGSPLRAALSILVEFPKSSQIEGAPRYQARTMHFDVTNPRVGNLKLRRQMNSSLLAKKFPFKMKMRIIENKW